MITNDFKKFIAKELGISIEEITSLELVGLFTVDVRALKPSLFASAIMFWCWFVRPSKWFQKWSTRHHHCAGVEVWRINKAIEIAVSYDAQLTYERNNFKVWSKKYNIINICNTGVSLELMSQEYRLKVHKKHESLVGTDYGKKTIAGIIVNDLNQTVIIWVDGEETTICSEAEIYPYMDFLPELEEPADLVDVIDRAKYFKMTKYNNELERFKVS